VPEQLDCQPEWHRDDNVFRASRPNRDEPMAVSACRDPGAGLQKLKFDQVGIRDLALIDEGRCLQHQCPECQGEARSQTIDEAPAAPPRPPRPPAALRRRRPIRRRRTPGRAPARERPASHAAAGRGPGTPRRQTISGSAIVRSSAWPDQSHRPWRCAGGVQPSRRASAASRAHGEEGDLRSGRDPLTRFEAATEELGMPPHGVLEHGRGVVRRVVVDDDHLVWKRGALRHEAIDSERQQVRAVVRAHHNRNSGLCWGRVGGWHSTHR
jgi:hypothetical protein